MTVTRTDVYDRYTFTITVEFDSSNKDDVLFIEKHLDIMPEKEQENQNT